MCIACIFLNIKYHPFTLFLCKIFVLLTYAHAHVDIKFVYYGFNFYNDNAKHTLSSFAKLHCNLKKPLVHSSCDSFMVLE